MACPRLFEPVDAAHLATCAECRAAQGVVEGLRGSAGELSAIRQAAKAELAAHPVARPWWLSALGFVASAGAAVLVASLALSSSAVQHRSPQLHAAFTGLWGALSLAGGVLALRPGARRARLVVLASYAVVSVASLAILSGVDASGAGSGCALSETLVALAPLAVGLAALSAFAFDLTRALTAGVAASSAGLLAIHLHCANGTLAHQLLFHLAPMIALAVVTVVVRRRMTSRSFAP